MARNNYQIAGFDPYEAVNRIYGLKGDWDNATDADKRNEIAKKAQASYAALRANGYGDVADKLTQSNYSQSKPIRDAYAMMGKTPVRQYIRNGLKRYGVSEADADKAITWNGATGEVGLGGINLGKPDAVVDGVSYTGNRGNLDNAIGEYAKRTGLSTPMQLKWNETFDAGLDNVKGMGREAQESAAISNEAMRKAIGANDKFFEEAQTPTTESADYRRVWHDVMPAFSYNADVAGMNAAAAGASTNGGNVDSFAAANARRQREASYANGARLAAELGLGARQTTMGNMNQGVQNYASQSTLAANNSGTIANANYANSRAYTDLLGSATDEMDAQAERRLADATTEQAKVATLDAIGRLTNEIPLAAYHYIYPDLVDENGRFTDKIHNVDLKAQIDTLRAGNKDGKNDAAIRLISELRRYKAFAFPDLYTDAIGQGDLERTEYGPSVQTDKQTASNEKIVDMNNKSAEKITGMNNASAEKIAGMNNQNALARIGAQAAADLEQLRTKYGLDAEQTKYLIDNGILPAGTQLMNGSGGSLSGTELKSIVNALNTDAKNALGSSAKAFSQNMSGGYSPNPNINTDWAVRKILNSFDADKASQVIDALGIPMSQVDSVTNSMFSATAPGKKVYID